jgi:hypothetical protein
LPAARYLIELRTADKIWTSVPYEGQDLRELRVEVAKFVGEILKDHAEKIWVDQLWRVDVADENGLILYVMHLDVTDSSATMPLRRP